MTEREMGRGGEDRPRDRGEREEEICGKAFNVVVPVVIRAKVKKLATHDLEIRPGDRSRSAVGWER